jgi:hypothetical protein
MQLVALYWAHAKHAATVGSGWTTLLEMYEATPVESWAFRQILRGVLPDERKRQPRSAGKIDYPQSLSMLSFAGDERGLAIAPQLAAFASSLGITTRLVTAVGHASTATLWRQVEVSTTLRSGQPCMSEMCRMARRSTSRST